MLVRPTVIALMAVVAVLLGCSDEPTDETPEGSLVLFLEAMERSQHTSSALHHAYELLSAGSQDQLRERAENAGSPGHTIEPWQMLVRGRFRVRLDWRRSGALSTRLEGEEATVTVTGRDGTQANVPMVREHGHWRIALNLATEALDAEEVGSDAGIDGGPDADAGG